MTKESVFIDIDLMKRITLEATMGEILDEYTGIKHQLIAMVKVWV